MYANYLLHFKMFHSTMKRCKTYTPNTENIKRFKATLSKRQTNPKNSDLQTEINKKTIKGRTLRKQLVRKVITSINDNQTDVFKRLLLKPGTFEKFVRKHNTFLRKFLCSEMIENFYILERLCPEQVTKTILTENRKIDENNAINACIYERVDELRRYKLPLRIIRFKYNRSGSLCEKTRVGLLNIKQIDASGVSIEYGHNTVFETIAKDTVLINRTHLPNLITYENIKLAPKLCGGWGRSYMYNFRPYETVLKIKDISYTCKDDGYAAFLCDMNKSISIFKNLRTTLKISDDIIRLVMSFLI